MWRAPGVPGVGSDPSPFVDPNFFLELFQSFAPGEGGSAVVQDMETAAVARIATESVVQRVPSRPAIPIISAGVMPAA